MSGIFPVEFASIPTFKRKKLFEFEGVILENKAKWTDVMKLKVSAVASQRVVLVICEDIATADEIYEIMSSGLRKEAVYLHTRGDGFDEYDGSRMHKTLKQKVVVITTNVGARGTDFVTDDVVKQEWRTVCACYIHSVE